jgi:hypothetical protein
MTGWGAGCMQWLGDTAALTRLSSRRIGSNADDVSIWIQVPRSSSPWLVARFLHNGGTASDNPRMHNIKIRYVKTNLHSSRDRTVRWPARIEREVNERSISPRVRGVRPTIPRIIKVAVVRFFR